MKLTHKEKIAIVRDAIIKYPRYNAYGFNRELRAYFRKEFDYHITDSNISRLKKQALEEMEKDKTILIGKIRLIEMHLSIYQGAKNPVDKTRSLSEIGKLEGLYTQHVHLTDDMTNGKLKALAQEIIERKVKESNGKGHNRRRKNPAKKRDQ